MVRYVLGGEIFLWDILRMNRLQGRLLMRIDFYILGMLDSWIRKGI